MSSRRPLVTKIIYLALIAILLIPLSILSRPATRTSNGELTQGGKLAQLRADYNLSQTSLGEIDPTSETIRLASLGMRNIAANILWHKANHYKKVEDWTNLSASVEQITKLQPNFFKVWDFQAHNLSYNISTQFDDYHDRYKWVIKGIEFYQEGQKYNQTDPRFEHNIGWFIGQKIGRADEHKQYRRLFREDDEFNADRRPQDRDNWLVAYEWYKRAEAKVKDPALIRGATPVLFYSEAAKALINFGEALETDGRFGDVAKTAWQNAAEEFLAFGKRVIPTTFGFDIQLENLEADKARIDRLLAELDELVPGGREKVRESKIAKLSAREREVLALPDEQRGSSEHYEMNYLINEKIKVSHNEIADLAEPDQLVEAREIAAELTHSQEVMDSTQRYREIVNYDYWRARSKAGFDDDWQKAKESLFKANESLRGTRFEEAQAAYEESFKHWRVILDRYPELNEESTTISDLAKEIDRYRRLLLQQDKKFPENFLLQDVVDRVGSDGSVAPTPPVSSLRAREKAAAEAKAPAGEGTAAPAGENTAAPTGESTTAAPAGAGSAEPPADAPAPPAASTTGDAPVPASDTSATEAPTADSSASDKAE